jgi:hypothetical protein
MWIFVIFYINIFKHKDWLIFTFLRLLNFTPFALDNSLSCALFSGGQNRISNMLRTFLTLRHRRIYCNNEVCCCPSVSQSKEAENQIYCVRVSAPNLKLSLFCAKKNKK